MVLSVPQIFFLFLCIGALTKAILQTAEERTVLIQFCVLFDVDVISFVEILQMVYKTTCFAGVSCVGVQEGGAFAPL